MQDLSIDIKTMPQAFRGYHLLLVITCDQTNFMIAVPLRDRTAQKVAEALIYRVIYVVPPQSWGDRSDTKHSKCLLLGGRRLNQLTLIPKPKGSGGARAATAQVGPANNRNDTKRCLPVEASLRPGEAVPW